MQLAVEYEFSGLGRQVFSGMAQFRGAAQGQAALCLHLVRDGATLGSWSPQFFPEEDDIVDFAFSTEKLKWNETIQSKYTSGDCEVFAVALLSVIDAGELVAVWEPSPDDDDEQAPPYLAHSGVLVGDIVYDVNGHMEYDQWAQKWAEKVDSPDDAEWGTVTQEFLEEMQAGKISEEDMDTAREYARLLQSIYLDTMDPSSSLVTTLNV